MARPLRIEYENAFYHVTSRGNSRGRIFWDDFDRDLFLDVIGDAYDRFGFIVHAFVLMDNHYHVLIETPNANLSVAMRHINGVYTQAFNRRHKAVGHLLQGRFKAIVVDKDAYYLELIRYIHLNPWRARMVTRLDTFKYSSHKAIVDRVWAARWKRWYDRDMVLTNFGRRERDAIQRYREFVKAGEGKGSPLAGVIGGYALGDRKFADWLWEEFIDGREDREISGLKRMRPKVELSRVVKVVSDAYGVTEQDLFKAHRGRVGANVPRGLALYMMSRHSGMTQREIGESVGGMSGASVGEAARQTDRLLKGDSRLRSTCQCLLKKLK